MKNTAILSLTLAFGLLLCGPVQGVIMIGATPYATIQLAIDASVGGDTIDISAGTYAESLIINSGGDKNITLNGVGSGSNAASNTIIDGIGGQTIDIRAGGTAALMRLTLSNMRVTGGVGGGNTGMGIKIGGGAAINHITFDNVASVGNGGHGIGLDHTNAAGDIVISQSNLSNNTGSGLRFPSSMGALGTVDVSGTTFQNNTGFGFESLQPATISVTTSTFSGNSANVSTGGEFVLSTGAVGVTDVTFNDVSFTAANSETAIRISPRHDGGSPREGVSGATISMTDVTFSGTHTQTGTYASAPIYISRLIGLVPGDITFDNVVINATADYGLFLGTITNSTIDLDGGIDFSGGTFANYSIALSKHGNPASSSYALSTGDVWADGLGLTEADVFDVGDDPLLGDVILIAATSPVPEPATLLLAGLGLAGMACLRRRRRKS